MLKKYKEEFLLYFRIRKLVSIVLSGLSCCEAYLEDLDSRLGYQLPGKVMFNKGKGKSCLIKQSKSDC